MKTIIAAILIISSLAIAAEDDAVTLFSTTGQVYNSVWKNLQDRAVRMMSGGEQGTVLFAYMDYSGVVGVTLDAEGRSRVRKIIAKYIEWNRKATQKGVEITKEIGAVQSVPCAFPWASEFHIGLSTVRFGFYSMDTGDHRLSMSIDKVTSSKNQFVSTTPNTLYLEKKEASALLKALSEKVIRAKIAAEMKKRRSVYSDFE